MKIRPWTVFVAIVLICGLVSYWRWSERASLAASEEESTREINQAQDTAEIVPIKGTGPAVYLRLSDNTIRHIQNWDTFIALGFQPQDIVEVSDETLATYELGASISRWVMSDADEQIYLVWHGQRVPVNNALDFNYLEGNPLEISVLTPALLELFPEASTGMPELFDYARPTPIRDAIWWDDELCVVRAAIECWQPTENTTHLYDVGNLITSLGQTADDLHLAGTVDGQVWHIAPEAERISTQGSGSPDEIITSENTIYHIDRNAYDTTTNTFLWGQGVIQTDRNTGISQPLPNQPRALQDATALVKQAEVLWVGTRYAGLWQFDGENWTAFNTLNSAIPDNTIYDLALTNNGALWLSLPHRLGRYKDGQWQEFNPGDSFTVDHPDFSLAIQDDKVWFAGENMIGYRAGGEFHTYTAFDHPNFLDYFVDIVSDSAGNLWFIGQERFIEWNPTTDTWTAYDQTDGLPQVFDPHNPTLTPIPDFPSPQTNYEDWLQTWSRPAQDTGRCIHYLQYLSGSSLEIREQIARMQSFGMRWALVNYPARSQLLQMAPIFAEAGITVIWRPYVRPYETYPYWAEDVKFLRALGLSPYIQVYNEPSLGQEWESDADISQEVYLENLIPAMQAVYDAGGYPGIQLINLDWARRTAQTMREANIPLDRFFFVPHPYGFNHPPEYDHDEYAVLGFQQFADMFAEELGFVPMMVAGEGGWRLGEQQDQNYPAITEELHRDYHVEVFNWFSSGTLSNGDPLPDYLFAYCPWLISDPNDAAGWFDSSTGNRQLTVDAVRNLPIVERQFSWMVD